MSSTARRFFADLPPATGLDTRAGRGAAIRRAARHLARQCIAPDGRWILDDHPPEDRQWLWLAGSLLHDGDLADRPFAEALIVNALPTDPATGMDLKPAGAWSVFANNHAITLLCRHREVLGAAARERLMEWARQALAPHPGDRQADYQFHGYNDNMPAKATCGLILGGELLGDPGAVAHGLWLLRQLRDQFSRRGVISEHCSPTYSPLTLAYLEEIAHDASDAEARSIATGCAERMWAELLGRYHPGLGLASGPSSRNYATDSVGQLSQLNHLLWHILGAEVIPDPLAELTREPARLLLHHEGDRFFNLVERAWFTTMPWNPPAHLVEWMRTRGFPHRMVATAERAEGANPAGMSHAAGTILATSWHEPDFALGTSDGDWGHGQAEEWHLAWRRRAPARDPADLRCAFVRMLPDDARPGIPAVQGIWRGEAGFAGDLARSHTLQAGRSSMLLMSPATFLAGRSFRRLRMLLAVGEHLAPLPRFELDAAQRCLWIEDGPLRIGVRFLGCLGFGAPAQLAAEHRDGYALAWLNLWDGPGRSFTADELATASCGYVAEVGLAAEETRAAFEARVLAAPLTDYEYFGQRTVRWAGAGGALAMSVGLRSWGRRYATIDGRQVAEPAWEATGLPAARLPFLGGVPDDGLYELPHADLGVHFAPWERWAIHSRAGGPAARSVP